MNGNCLAYVFFAKLNLLEIMKASRSWGLLSYKSLWLRLETVWAVDNLGHHTSHTHWDYIGKYCLTQTRNMPGTVLSAQPRRCPHLSVCKCSRTLSNLLLHPGVAAVYWSEELESRFLATALYSTAWEYRLICLGKSELHMYCVFWNRILQISASGTLTAIICCAGKSFGR